MAKSDVVRAHEDDAIEEIVTTKKNTKAYRLDRELDIDEALLRVAKDRIRRLRLEAREEERHGKGRSVRAVDHHERRRRAARAVVLGSFDTATAKLPVRAHNAPAALDGDADEDRIGQE